MRPISRLSVRPTVVSLLSGETADYEFTPDRPGELALEVLGQQEQGGRNLTVHGRLPFRVSPAAGDSGSAKSSGARARPRR